MGRYFRISLFLLALGIALTAFAVTDEVSRVAELADKLYVEQRYDEAFPMMMQAAEGGDDMAKDMVNRLDKQTFIVNGVSFTMVAVEGGTFTMGATSEQGSDAYSNEIHVHQVTLSSFSIGQTEVTQALWQAVMGSHPSKFTGNLQHPVEQVSWDDCQEFIAKLNQITGQNFRLPTEAEWEYAARGGNRSKGYKYSGSNTIGDVAWYIDNSNNQTHAVAKKAANELGLYDMSGNVWEWCWDWYGFYSVEAQTDPKGRMYGPSRVYRGGSWGSIARGSRVSYRNFNIPWVTDSSLGLRLAL